MVRILFLEHLPNRLSTVKDVFLEFDQDLDYDVRVFEENSVESTDIVAYDVIVFDGHILPVSTFTKIDLGLLKDKCVLVVIEKDDLTSVEHLNLDSLTVDNILIPDLPQYLHATIKRELAIFSQRIEINQRKQTELLLNAITDISRSLLEIQNLDEIARLVIDRIVKHFDFEDCVIYEVNKDAKSLTQIAAKGPKEDVAYHVKNPLTLQFGQGIVGTVAESGNSILLNDVRSDSRYFVDDAERCSELTVPIILNGKVIGIIDSENHDLGFYSDRDRQNLEAVASVIAIKFHAAQLRSEKENVQEELRKSLDEKTVLLSEVHHRVKNNLAIISGLLHLQSDDLNHPELLEIMLEMSNRIQSIAEVHELLYNSDSFADITFEDYTQNLFRTISSTIQKTNRVKLNLDIDYDLKININQAIPLGLILNELVTNSFKYAFDMVPEPMINFSLRLLDGRVIGEYSDNGPGFSSDYIANPKSLGFTVINALFAQLEADLHYDLDKVYPLIFNFEYYQQIYS